MTKKYYLETNLAIAPACQIHDYA